MQLEGTGLSSLLDITNPNDQNGYQLFFGSGFLVTVCYQTMFFQATIFAAEDNVRGVRPRILSIGVTMVCYLSWQHVVDLFVAIDGILLGSLSSILMASTHTSSRSDLPVQVSYQPHV